MLSFLKSLEPFVKLIHMVASLILRVVLIIRGDHQEEQML
jgi:hypothetical protein